MTSMFVVDSTSANAPLALFDAGVIVSLGLAAHIVVQTDVKTPKKLK